MRQPLRVFPAKGAVSQGMAARGRDPWDPNLSLPCQDRAQLLQLSPRQRSEFSWPHLAETQWADLNSSKTPNRMSDPLEHPLDLVLTAFNQCDS